MLCSLSFLEKDLEKLATKTKAEIEPKKLSFARERCQLHRQRCDCQSAIHVTFLCFYTLLINIASDHQKFSLSLLRF